jgi:hypothetical protein
MARAGEHLASFDRAIRQLIGRSQFTLLKASPGGRRVAAAASGEQLRCTRCKRCKCKPRTWAMVRPCAGGAPWASSVSKFHRERGLSSNNLVLLSSVALLFWMGISVMAPLPLLVLRHDTPSDARFVRGLFNVSYRAVIGLALVGALAYGHAGLWVHVARLLVLAGADAVVRRWLLSRMDRLRLAGEPDAGFDKRGFRRLHLTGIAINASQIAVPVLGLMTLHV